MKLFYHPMSNNGRLALAVAKHLGVALDLQVIDLMKGEHRTDDYLGLNPNGKVPTLQDGDFVLWESNAIAQYLAEGVENDTPFFPRDRRSRADLLRWQSWAIAHLGPATSQIAYERAFKPMMGQEPNLAKIDQGLVDLARYGKVLDQHLAARPYLLGDALTLADFAVGAAFTYAPMANYPLDDFPNVKAWLARLDEIPAWSETGIQGR